MKVTEKFINNFKENLLLHRKLVEDNCVTPQESNRIARKNLKHFIKIEQEVPFLQYYIDIIKKEPSLARTIAQTIRKYESNIARKLYQKAASKDEDKRGLLVVKYWDEDQKRIEQENQEQIQKYQLWKKENPEEAQRIIQELENIIDSGMIE